LRKGAIALVQHHANSAKQAELARFTRINAAAQVNHSSFTSRLQAYDLRRAGRLIVSVFSAQT
jgi:hypothetical protein